MTNWTSGYVADVGYTFGYYAELNPGRAKLPLLNRGLCLPDIIHACELGFGQGLSTNIHAAASTVKWVGTDFNPSQAATAQEFAEVAQNNARLYDESFEEFVSRTDLPDFDYIGLHGIWSWISDENRFRLVEFIKQKLKVGGILYISYNTLPGWAAFAPMRHLMTQHADVIGSEGKGIVSRIDDAIEFADKLIATNPLYARANPQVSERLKKLKSQNRHYLAHEYFNKDWHPMHFSTMAEWLEPAKLTFAGSAHYLDHVDPVNLTNEQQSLLSGITDIKFKESTRDFMVNQQFRRDYWIKGPRTMSALEQAEQLREVRLVMVMPESEVVLKVTGALGEAEMSETIYRPIIDLMADFRIRTLGQIEEAVKGREIAFVQLIQAIMILSSQGVLAPAQEDAVINKARKSTDRLNQHLFYKARSASDIAYVASPVTGGGVLLTRFQQLFVYAYLQGKKLPSEWANYVWSLLSSQNQRILRDGKPIETPEENLQELELQANALAKTRLSLLKALQIV